MRRILPSATASVAIIAVGLFVALRFPQPAAAQSAAAQGNVLTFGDNFFVTGDYAIGGAVLGKSNNGFVTGEISIGNDQNPGVKGTNTVPLGAEIVAALLYWQEIEIVGGATGQNGSFRPVFNGGPQKGYPIKGTILKNPNGIVHWDGTGCASSTTPKQLVTYRQEVRAFLPQDAQGNVIANGQYEVVMPSQSNGSPLTVGVSLVIIYRVVSPDFPLNSIVIYDGTPASAPTPTGITQNIQGFYDVADSRVSKLTYIAGNGRMNLSETVSLNGTPLPSLYKTLSAPSTPPFPGWYGTWDNPTWFLGPATKPPNPLPGGASLATTEVVSAHQGCITPAAIIYSTTVKNSDGDGLLDSWKTNQGYCDASFNEAGAMLTPGSCTAAGSQWVDLTGAAHGQKDVFVQLNYMCYKLLGSEFPLGSDSCDTSTSFANSLSAASAASGGTTTYTGVFSPTFPLNTFIAITGFSNPQNNGNFIVVSNTGNQLVVNNANGVAEVHAGTAAFTDYSFDPRQVTDSVTSFANPLSAASAASGGTTTYTGVFSPTFPLNTSIAITGFSNPQNNGIFLVVSNTGNQLVVNNANGVAEVHAGTSTFTGANSFDEVNTAYFNKGITLHPKWHAMAETPGCTDTVVSGIPSYCPYLNQPGLVGWKGGFDVLKGQPLNLNSDGTTWTEAQCEASPTTCVRRFEHGQKDSYHEVIFAHAQGGPEWSFQGGTLTTGALCPAGTACIAQVGNTITFYTSTSHGLVAASGPNDQNPLARVTVSDAITNTMLNGTYLVQSITDKSFTIQVGFAANETYTPSTDPRLSAASGRIHTRSGFSDVGGADSLVTLGRWDPVLAQQITGTTFMHEFGHANGLSHGGYYYDQLTSSPNNYTPTVEPNCKPNFQSVMNYPFQLNHLDNGTSKVVDYSEEQLDTLDEQHLPAGVTIGMTRSPFYPNTLWYTPTAPSSTASPAKLTCDGMAVPPGITMYLIPGPADPIFPAWGNAQDIDFNLKPDGSLETSAQLRGHSDWTSGSEISPGMNLQQVGATGADAFGSGGSLGPGGGSLGPGGGSLGPGGGSLGPGGGSLGPGGGSLGPGGAATGDEVDVTTATAVTYAPSDLTAMEGVSPRTITLNWTPGFGLIAFYKIFRSDDGGTTFKVIGTVNAPTTTFTDNPGCKPTGGYQYFVSAVQSSSSPNPGSESGPSNTVSTGQNPPQPLTGCYVVSSFLSPASGVQGTGLVPITWTLTDASNTAGAPVTRQAANTLVAIGPLPNNCTMNGRTTLLADGVPTTPLVDTFANVANQFTFTWNNTDAFCAGSYTFELDLDHVQGSPAQVQPDPTPLQLSIDVNDTDSTPHVATLVLSAGTVGLAYSNTLTQHGGTAPFTWTFTGSLPNGITQQAQNSPTLSGTTCIAGPYSFTAMVTDSKSNSGTQPLTLQINKANTTTGVISNANPSVFQQMVTFTVTVAPQYSCTPTGTVTLLDGVNPIASNLPLTGGIATFTTSALSVGVHNITASYSGDSNFNGSSSAILVQTVKPAQTTTTINSVSSPAIVGQAITVSYALAVLSPGAGTPIKPTGTVMVTSSDGSSCPAVPVVLGPGVCVLSPVPTKAGPWAVTVTYSSADGNFVGSGANSPYVVYIYVSDAAPPPFTAVTTLPNGVVGSPYTNTVYESGGVTGGASSFAWALANGSNPLPAGLSLGLAPDGVSGLISGTPTMAGTFTFTAMVTDSAGNTGTQNLKITVFAPAPAPSGLVSWYPFEGNANDLEKINNGNVVGTPQFVPGEVDNGFKPVPQLSGSLITVPDSPTLALPQFTIGAWVRVDNLDNVETMQIVWKGDMTAGDLTTPYSLSVLGSAPSNFNGAATVVGAAGPGKVLVILTDGTHELDLVSTNALPLDGKFHYVAVTADGQKVNLYIDGVLDPNMPASETSLTGLPFTSANPLQIGGIQGGPAPGNNFDGVIDELQIWNRVLAAAEISGIFNTVGEYQPAARPAGLVSWWSAEGNYTDIISGYNGVPSGGVGFAPGEVGQAFSFSGGAGEIQVADNANLDVGQITIEAWVKPTTSGHGRPIVQKRSSANVGGYTFETTDTSDGPGPANGLQFAIWISRTQYLLQTPANALTINAWQHVAATYDGLTMNIYINGALLASQATPGGSIDTDSADPLVMGLNVFNSHDWNGFTDEVSLYNRALSFSEIQSIVNAGGAGKAKP